MDDYITSLTLRDVILTQVIGGPVASTDLECNGIDQVCGNAMEGANGSKFTEV